MPGFTEMKLQELLLSAGLRETISGRCRFLKARTILHNIAAIRFNCAESRRPADGEAVQEWSDHIRKGVTGRPVLVNIPEHGTHHRRVTARIP